jgi:D-serine deaminase-like pyridoxal phosphate-dependent protein
VTEVDTPAVVVDVGRAEANIAKLQSYLDQHGIANRPHVKTHKLPLLARRQVDAGAIGITVQTLGEAEVMAASGLDDLLVTYNLIGDHKAARLARLARMVKVQVAVDNAVALRTIAAAAALAERRIGVLVEFESGKQRQGVLEPEQALVLAREAAAAPFLRFEGLLTYPASPLIEPFVEEARRLFASEGIEITTVSAGGTPDLWRAHELAGVTEYRAGTYVYHDRPSLHRGEAVLDECALHVHVTVVSMPTPDRGVIDAGSKVLTSDLVPPEAGSGYGLILEYPDAVVTQLSEEHGVVDFSRCDARPRLGDRLRVLPNHVCPVSNLVDEVVLHREGVVEAVVPVAARGKR